jgi:hypothetical protein
MLAGTLVGASDVLCFAPSTRSRCAEELDMHQDNDCLICG